jgi:hypothetical protein
MGAVSSRLSDGASYQKRAITDAELSNTILKLFFETADVNDLINLTSVEACPAYVFTTAKSLKKYFTEMNLYPGLGEDGKIVYAHISDLVPGLVKNKDSKKNAELLKKQVDERNKTCIDLGYYWVRIFQIYAALALTVLDASPLRSNVLQQKAAAAAAASGPKNGTFKKGPLAPGKGESSGLFGFFRGGAISDKGLYKNLAQEIKESNFEPLLPIVTPTKSADDRMWLGFDDKRKPENGKVYIQWQKQRRNNVSTQQTLQGVFIKGTFQREFQITATRTDDGGAKLIDMVIDGQLNQRFLLRGPPVPMWVLMYDNEIGTSPEEFFRNIYDYFDSIVEANAAGLLPRLAPGLQGVAAPAAGPLGVYQPQRIAQIAAAGQVRPPSGIVSIPAGKSIYDGYDELKKVLKGKLDGLGIPKAYCVARAMTLLNPIFDEEMKTLGKSTYTSSICDKTYDFETAGALMPRTGTQPKTNIYWRSLVALFYDEYAWSGNQIIFTQSETGRSDLKRVSSELAFLYNVDKAPENFLESAIPFRLSTLCNQREGVIEIPKENFPRELRNGFIKPMLDFQEKHSQDVNTFLKEMFRINYKDKKAVGFEFTPSLAGKDKKVVNEFGKRAAQLLLRYYKTSEGLYNQALDFYAENQSMWRLIPTSGPLAQQPLPPGFRK